MDFYYILAILAGIIGIAGCFLPVIPGPPISYVGVILLYMSGRSEAITPRFLIIWLIITVVVTVLDYVIPAFFTKRFGGSAAGSKASLVGMVIGIIFFPPIGMIVGAFLGALIAEILVDRKSFANSIKPAFGSFIGFLAGTGIKLIVSITMFVYILFIR